MPRDEKRRQKALQRHAAKRKQKVKALRTDPHVTPLSPSLRRAASWTLLECLMTTDWQKEGELVQIIVARRSELGQVAMATFLIDLGCLGVKSAIGHIFDSQREYETGPRARMTEMQSMKKVDLDLAAKVIREGLTYAREFGFKPDPDYYGAAVLLEGANPDAARDRVPLGGKDGKPFFIGGPNDNVPLIMSKLERALGAEGVHFTVPVPVADLVFDEVDEVDDLDEDDEDIIEIEAEKG